MTPPSGFSVKMQLPVVALSACLVASSLLHVHGAFAGNVDKKLPQLANKQEGSDELIDDVDFDGDEIQEDDFKGLLDAGSEDSLMHIHRVDGEILVPCFGMWWPAGGYGGGGGGSVGYEYVDYYGDYRKKRRRNRRQKKAAKAKRKKS